LTYIFVDHSNVSECATSAQEQSYACVHVVNANFSTLHSGPLMVPLQSSFLNLDVVFGSNFTTAFAPPTPPPDNAASKPPSAPLMPLPPDPPLPLGQLHGMHLQEQATSECSILQRLHHLLPHLAQSIILVSRV
jgi:hypothetical protein